MLKKERLLFNIKVKLFNMGFIYNGRFYLKTT